MPPAEAELAVSTELFEPIERAVKVPEPFPTSRSPFAEIDDVLNTLVVSIASVAAPVLAPPVNPLPALTSKMSPAAAKSKDLQAVVPSPNLIPPFG
jgi:hypothetical protein